MDIDGRLRTTIEDDLKAYFSKRDEVVAVFLFGSHARERQRPGSDVDVGVLLQVGAGPDAGDLRALYIVELGRILKKVVHPVLLNTAGEELLKQIFSKGRCLLVNHERPYALFRIAAYGRIADFDLYRRMARKGFIKRLKREVKGG